MNTIWIKAACIRAVKTVAQAAIGAIGASALMSEVDWKLVASASVLAGIISILTSVVGIPEAGTPTMGTDAWEELSNGYDDADNEDPEEGEDCE